MLRILLNGCNGRMGHAISDIVKDSDNCEVVAGIDINTKTNYKYPVFSSTKEVDVDFDVIIDFSVPSALMPVIELAAESKKPIVIATTGLSEEHVAAYKQLSEKTAVFVSANMSLGINMLMRLAGQAAGMLYGDFDIEIVEAHHNKKVDAPSGTALMLAEHIRSSADPSIDFKYDRHLERKTRSKQEIGIHSVRGGSIPGDHKIIFAGNQEVIELSHRAQSRSVFAQGAVSAANFIYGKPAGMYSMNELLDVR